MQPDEIRRIANAILYEGYMLYPYRPSAFKNQRPGWSFGTLLPPAYAERNPGDSAFMEGQMLMSGAQGANLNTDIRFLQLRETAGESPMEQTASLIIPIKELLQRGQKTQFCSENGEGTTVEGLVEIDASPVSDSALRLTVRVSNRSNLLEPPATRDAALKYSLVAAHAIVQTDRGEFVSLLDPPEELRIETAACRQTGVFPVLIGDEGTRTNMLLSPIILGDYPRIAPESPGDFFDSAEIDELLTLRLLTLADSEKEELRSAGEITSNLLNRTQACTPQDLLRMHGAIRERAVEKEQS